MMPLNWVFSSRLPKKIKQHIHARRVNRRMEKKQLYTECCRWPVWNILKCFIAT